jgi:hypothetical protein
LSKPSAAELTFVRVIKERMAEGDIRSVINDEPATDFHHPLGNALWETGKGLKAHEWFRIPLTTRQHREYHLWGRETWERTYGTHEMLLRRFWKSIGFVPSDFLVTGMGAKRAEWCKRVLFRLGLDDNSAAKLG